MNITKREIIASITIIAIMLLFGTMISGRIKESELDAKETYLKAIHINDSDLFKHAMSTNVGNAFVYGDLIALDPVTYPEIGGEYMRAEKVEERYERHEKWETKKDSNGKEHRELKVWYEWDVAHRESIHSNRILFCGVEFPYEQIDYGLYSSHIETIKGDKVYSLKSGERVKVRFKYYGISTTHKGSMFADLRNNNIPDNTRFYNEMSTEDLLNCLMSMSNGGVIIFWILWTLLIGAVVYGFYYLDNTWLERE